MKNLYSRRKELLNRFNEIIAKKQNKVRPTNIPSNLFIKCDLCGGALYTKILESKDYVCPFCDNHLRINANKRIDLLIDNNSFIELDSEITSADPLKMPNYIDKLNTYKKLTDSSCAFKSGSGTIYGIKVALGVLDSTFMMGSMGSAAGEKITRLIEFATKNKLPLIIVSSSGGARMQEGILSLMQMAKTSMAISRHNEAGLLYISIMTNPTTGGVAASFASLGDIIIAEKSALIGFAGPRVIKQTIGQDLPQGFQTETFQLKNGQVDLISDRISMKKTISDLLIMHNERTIYDEQ